ncbi:MAG: hypothetical protein AAFT19_06115 [Pseudomonadota bacterium]
MHPTDELDEIRLKIRALKRREAALRRLFLDTRDPAIRCGRRWQVMVETQRAEILDVASLPPQILEDRRYWTARLTQRVCLVPLGDTPAAPAREPPPAAAAGCALPQPQAEAPASLVEEVGRGGSVSRGSSVAPWAARRPAHR